MSREKEMDASAKSSLPTVSSTDNATASSHLWQAGALVIVAVGTIAYLTSFKGAFNFDDRYLLDNSYIRHLWPPWPALFAPPNVNRPLIGLSLAINYAISGLNVWSYHALNLLIHILASLTLFGIVRRTLLNRNLREQFGPASFSLALVVALIWMTHPLQTQSVTYIIQRCESLMGLFYLLTLYCVIRGFESPHKRWWHSAAIAACGAGMLSKQVMVTAPLVVLLYDGLFLSGSLKAALSNRKRLYASLGATWILLAATIIAAPVNETAGFAVKTITPWEYFKSEFGVIMHYLRLSVWPDPLVVDYDWPKATTAGEIVPFALIVGALGAATIWTLIRRKPVAFFGVWFFLIISLTSSFMPFADLAFEHRMYLPLASVVSLIVLGGYVAGKKLLRRLLSSERSQRERGRAIAVAMVTVIVSSLCFLTLRRNVDYQNEIVLWADVVAKRPQNSRGHNNLGMLLAERGYFEEAASHFSEACKYNPNLADAHNNWGLALSSMGKYEEGRAHLHEALRLNPNSANAHYNLGRNLAGQGRLDESISSFLQAVRIDPGHAEAYFNFGLALERQGKLPEAINNFKLALRLRPDWAGALSHLAFVLATHDGPDLRNAGEALQLAQRAVSLTKGQHPLPLDALAAAYAKAGRLGEAVEAAQKAVEMASASGNQELAASIGSRLQKYRNGSAHIDAPKK